MTDHSPVSLILVVSLVRLLSSMAIVVSIVVSLLLQLGQTVHQVVRGLVGDVTEDPVHQRFVPFQLMLDGVATGGIRYQV